MRIVLRHYTLPPLIFNKSVFSLLPFLNFADYECKCFVVPGLTGTKMSASDEVRYAYVNLVLGTF